MTFSDHNSPLISRTPRRSVTAVMTLVFALVLSFTGASTSAQAQTLKILYSFNGFYPTSPVGNLVRDAAGNLYGLNFLGGSFGGLCFENDGCGIVFKLDAAGDFTLLHTFQDQADGLSPTSLVGDGAGLVAGTTLGNTLYKVSATGQFSSIDPFRTPADGNEPLSLIRDMQGNLYGTTGEGGNLNCNSSPYPNIGCGTVFKLDKAGKFTVLYNFNGPPDGNGPLGVIPDAAGNLYGVTGLGGDTSCPTIFTTPGCGIVFKVDGTGHETILYTFAGGADGAFPGQISVYSGVPLVLDAAGNLYGTAWGGGDLTCGSSNQGCGVVFKVDTTGAETVLHTFTGQPDGDRPNAGMVRDAAGNLYGTTVTGGQFNLGTIFRLDTNGNLTVVYNFGVGGASDGQNPSTGLTQDAAGNLYGMTASGGSNHGGGTIFELTP